MMSLGPGFSPNLEPHALVWVEGTVLRDVQVGCAFVYDHVFELVGFQHLFEHLRGDLLQFLDH